MPEISSKTDIAEVSKSEVEIYKEIKPESDITVREAKEYWDNLFGVREDISEKWESEEANENDNIEKNIEQTLDDYFEDLKDKSDYPETIPDRPFEASNLEKRTPEENAEMRDEFDDKKLQLKQEWEEANERPWPKYEEDVYSSNGKLIRRAGSDYDAHHIQPLTLGGKNEVDNITPLHAEVHYDKQGIHAPESPYSKLNQMLGGME